MRHSLAFLSILLAIATSRAFYLPLHSNSLSKTLLTWSSQNNCQTSQELVSCPWFPTTRKELDFVSQKSEDGGVLTSEHPGFHDPEYRKRRRMIADKAFDFRFGDKLPHIDYTEDEHTTWKLVYECLRPAARQFAVPQYNQIVDEMEQTFGFGADRIPQLQQVSDYLEGKTGFTLRPVSGLLPAREFLAGLALRVFHSSQYLRHGSRPFYTPEPDIVHELLGHAPMLADADFAALSQEIGLASLGASDEEVRRLAACYWFSVEFGLCRAERPPRAAAASSSSAAAAAAAPACRARRVLAYGAGVISSLDELLHACSPGPAGRGGRAVGGGGGAAAAGPAPAELRAWRPAEAARTEYPITTLQPRYFVAPSLAAAKARIRDYAAAAAAARGFRARAEAGRVETDRPVRRVGGPAAAGGGAA